MSLVRCALVSVMFLFMGVFFFRGVNRYGAWLLGGVVIAVALAFAGCNGSTSAPPATSNGAIPMAASAWQIRYSPGMPTQPLAGTGFQFDFPSNIAGACPAPTTAPPNFNVSPCHHVDYVTTPWTAPITAKSMTMTFSLVATSPAYDYRTAPNNTCVLPAASVRLFLEHAGDAGLDNPVYRWWSDPIALTLQPGGSNLMMTVPLTPDQWSNVNGQFGSANPAAFADTLRNVGAVGMTFGGGCFFGHGVYLDAGSARFIVTKFALE